ncbi:glycoside hydrolase family 2 protein [Martelella alba]|uniref:Glycoside hydrolase family 2 protein n=1 Tax=Martelella alba TaxID=2590451 RepID=A0A506U4G5_9HYPH|nr:glycoside hydrolase family 2 TIM barrel-domain containing protein [Martelella alba]TPW28216.1 glycoside hydrolase family 2 protein [Martelella alba]
MRKTVSFNRDWTFSPGFHAAAAGTDCQGTAVTLPHNAVDLPFSYLDETSYWKAFTYQKRFTADADWAGREVVLVFDGAMANSVVYLNGVEIAAHPDGYTPFEARLTEHLTEGENLLTVKVDGSENKAIPPFGARIDYLTYAGIYRDVWLEVRAPVSIANCKVETPDVLAPSKHVHLAVELANPQAYALDGARLHAVIETMAGEAIATGAVPVSGEKVTLDFDGLDDVALWDIDSPVLYCVALKLTTAAGDDERTVRFGFRDIAFTPEGFSLNGRPLKLRGLNRHQSFPYVGYALGRAAQIRDAEILKHELKLNIVRTSHYPQSSWFLDRCDEIGLLVFEEIPGWQHVGDDAWQAAAVDNVAAMIRRDWNHPSIIIWGVRINESRDVHDFYTETNRVAHALDSTRPTTGVRCITDSELLEDVYSMNDFILNMEEISGQRPRTALRPRREVTGLDRPVPYLITEFNGHMYPTKVYDQEQRQAEHVTRHLEVLDAAYGDPEISGAIGWCAFDYNTHKDFGSGDRICHHGVMDMNREPKFAAYVYASQCDPQEGVTLMPVTYWTRGDRNHGGVLPLIILTNCDEVELDFAGHPPRRFKPDRALYKHLPHAPVIIRREDYPGPEFGHWGMGWQDVTFTGYVDGAPVKTARYISNPLPNELSLTPDAPAIGEDDCVRVMVRVLDQAGNKLPYLFEPISIAVEGPGTLAGPAQRSLNGGATGFWVTACGAGTITLSVTHASLGTRRVTVTAG